MKEIEEWLSKLNPQQKLILGIVIPIGLAIIFYPIADEFDETHRSEPFDFKRTWLVWLIYISIVGFIEFKLFENKKT